MSGQDIPGDVYTILSKRKGCVPTPNPKSYEYKKDCLETMGKLSNATKRRIRPEDNSQNLDAIENEVVDDLAPKSHFPKELTRKRAFPPEKTGDKVVDQLSEEISAEINRLEPEKLL